MRSVLYIPLLALALAGCRPGGAGAADFSLAQARTAEVLPPAEFVEWCKDADNGLVKAKRLEDITFSLQYKPAAYVLCTENDSMNAASAELTKEMSELDGLDYYDFTIKLTEGTGELLKYRVGSYHEYDARVNYMSFGMQNDVKLIAGSDTLDCQLFHFERTYDIAPYATLLLAFPKTAGAGRTFLYEDKLFGKGIVKFTFTKEELGSVPQLQAL
jgi:hypothetical protein